MIIPILYATLEYKNILLLDSIAVDKPIIFSFFNIIFLLMLGMIKEIT